MAGIGGGGRGGGGDASASRDQQQPPPLQQQQQQGHCPCACPGCVCTTHCLAPAAAGHSHGHASKHQQQQQHQYYQQQQQHQYYHAAATTPTTARAAAHRRAHRRRCCGAGAGAGLCAPRRLLNTPSWLVLLLVTAAGVALGFAFPSPKMEYPYSALQSACGWTYTMAWSLSFYPQVLLNFQRRSVAGLSMDFVVLNLLGWVAYSTFNVAIWTVFECHHARAPAPPLPPAPAPPVPLPPSPAPSVAFSFAPPQQPQQQWWAAPARGGGDAYLGAGFLTLPPASASAPMASLLFGSSSTNSSSSSFASAAANGPPHGVAFCDYAVEFNDVVFSVHALVLTAITFAQCCLYPRGAHQRVHRSVVITVVAAVALAAVYAGAIRYQAEWGLWVLPWPVQRLLQWVCWLYFLSYIKMAVTLVKYVPQAVFNARRRSTRGWSVLNVQLDLMGGLLSLGQQLFSCWWAGEWEPVTANPVKVGLAVASIAMDAVFVFQHYVLYPRGGPGEGGGAKGLEGASSLDSAASAGGSGAGRLPVVVKTAVCECGQVVRIGVGGGAPASPLAFGRGAAAGAAGAGDALREPLLGQRSLGQRSVTICIEEADEDDGDTGSGDGDDNAAPLLLPSPLVGRSGRSGRLSAP